MSRSCTPTRPPTSLLRTATFERAAAEAVTGNEAARHLRRAARDFAPYGRTWRTVSSGGMTPYFQRVVFPDGFTPYRITESVAIGVLADSVDLQRVAVVRLASGPVRPS